MTYKLFICFTKALVSENSQLSLLLSGQNMEIYRPPMCCQVLALFHGMSMMSLRAKTQQ